MKVSDGNDRLWAAPDLEHGQSETCACKICLDERSSGPWVATSVPQGSMRARLDDESLAAIRQIVREELDKK